MEFVVCMSSGKADAQGWGKRRREKSSLLWPCNQAIIHYKTTSSFLFHYGDMLSYEYGFDAALWLKA